MVLPNARHEHFAQLVAAGASLVAAYIAAGYSKSGASASSSRLLANAEVTARVAELRQVIFERLAKVTIKELDSRIEAKQDRWTKLATIVKERAADPTMQHAPGAGSGYLVRTFKTVANEPVEEFAVDTGLLRAILDLENATAKELGQLVSKHEHTGANGGPILVTDPRLKQLSDDELSELQRTLHKLTELGGGDSGANPPRPL